MFNIPHDEQDGLAAGADDANGCEKQDEQDGLAASADDANGGGEQLGSGLNSVELGERTRRGKAAKAKLGLMPSGVGSGPYGHDYDPVLRRLVPNAVEAGNVVRAMVAVGYEGATTYRLVRQFNDEGIPAKRGGKWTYSVHEKHADQPRCQG